jgi:hypothetical protein
MAASPSLLDRPGGDCCDNNDEDDISAVAMIPICEEVEEVEEAVPAAVAAVAMRAAAPGGGEIDLPSVLEVLRCPVCLDVVRGPCIYLCTNGHMVSFEKTC